MTVVNRETAQCEMQRLTKLARATDDRILRADYYRMAETSRGQIAANTLKTLRPDVMNTPAHDFIADE